MIEDLHSYRILFHQSPRHRRPLSTAQRIVGRCRGLRIGGGRCISAGQIQRIGLLEQAMREPLVLLVHFVRVLPVEQATKFVRQGGTLGRNVEHCAGYDDESTHKFFGTFN